MRQVGRNELIYVIAAALRRVAPSTWNRAVDRRREVSDAGRVSMATSIADAMHRLEVLSGAPEAPENFFSGPLARMAGEDVPSGSPTLHEP